MTTQKLLMLSYQKLFFDFFRSIAAEFQLFWARKGRKDGLEIQGFPHRFLGGIGTGFKVSLACLALQHLFLGFFALKDLGAGATAVAIHCFFFFFCFIFGFLHRTFTHTHTLLHIHARL